MNAQEGTVTISIKDYLDLKNFKEAIDNGKVAFVHRYVSEGFYYSFYTKEETIKDLLNEKENLLDEIKKLKDVPSKITQKELSTMTIWQYLKWRKKVRGW